MFFKVSVPSTDSKVEVTADVASFTLPNPIWGRIEWVVVFAILILWGGPLPGVNETHYLTRAKGFWDASYCPGDLFIHAPVSHWCFYAGFGWLTQFLSLESVAWFGRILIAILFGTFWLRLARNLLNIPFFGFTSILLFLILNDRFHLAGEWVIGGIESKSFAYVFVLLALHALVQNRWHHVWFHIGLASAFHVLVGGWAGISLGMVRLATCIFPTAPAAATKKELSREAIFLLLGLAISLVGVVPPLASNWGSEKELSWAASQIYVQDRIGHHLDFAQFNVERIAKFLVLLAIWISVTRLFPKREGIQRIHWFCSGALLISLAGVLLSAMASSGQEMGQEQFAVSLLRFYWFRLSDFALPLATSLSLTQMGFLLYSFLHRRSPIYAKVSAFSILGLVALAGTLAVMETYQDSRPIACQRSLPKYESPEKNMDAFRNWKKACRWIQTNTPSDAVFLTPAQQQSFKWFAGRTEFVNWKDIPQHDASILEWYRRIQRVSKPQQTYTAGILAFTDEQLIELGRDFKIDYLLVPQKNMDAIGDSQLEMVYPENRTIRSTYVVLRLTNEPKGK